MLHCVIKRNVIYFFFVIYHITFVPKYHIMSLQREIFQLCFDALRTNKMQSYPLNGGGDKAKLRVRTYVSRNSRNGEIKTRYDAENDAVLIGTRLAVRNFDAKKPVPVKIPAELFRFVNGNDVSTEGWQQIQSFAKLLSQKVESYSDPNLSDGYENAPDLDELLKASESEQNPLI